MTKVVPIKLWRLIKLKVAILVALAVALGLIFKTEITDFVNKTFEGLNNF